MKMKKQMIFAIILTALLSPFYPVFADDVNISINVTEPPSVCGGETTLSQMLCFVGYGSGNIFFSMGTPLLIMIILIALGSAIGYFFEAVSKKINL
jgi:hypothetical protein